MDNTDPKSMDDVLASIRRIVRADKEDIVASSSAMGPEDDDPRGAADAEEPLALTPDMRVDADATGAAGELAADMSEAGAAADWATPNREALRAVLRELLREELSGGAGEDAVRGIIRDELIGGEIGNNVSQNVLRMIRAEVAKALHAPR